jgi:hypothetical protein
MNIETRKKIVVVHLTIEEQDLLIGLLRNHHHPYGTKNCIPEVNRFIPRFSNLLFGFEKVEEISK